MGPPSSISFLFMRDENGDVNGFEGRDEDGKVIPDPAQPVAILTLIVWFNQDINRDDFVFNMVQGTQFDGWIKSHTNRIIISSFHVTKFSHGRYICIYIYIYFFFEAVTSVLIHFTFLLFKVF